MSGEITQNLQNDKLQQILDQIDGVKTQLGDISQRLQALESKQHDTRPIWERALAELVEVNRHLDGIDGRLDSLDRRLSVLNDDILDSRAQQRRLERRVADIEHPRPS